MGAAVKDFVTFVENGKLGNSHREDYFGWHSFYDLSSDTLNDAKNVKELRIVDFDDKPITVSLATAALLFSQFQLCFSKPAMESSDN